MKAVFFTVLFACAYSALAVSMPRSTRSTVMELQEIIKKEGCNANVCFAIDGSGSISAGEFKRSKEFVLDAVAAISVNNFGATYSAVQYGIVPYPIIRSTTDSFDFATAVEATQKIRRQRTNVGSGIIYCSGELGRNPNMPLKIVVIGDGRNNFGGNPVRRADNFRNKYPNNSAVCAVGIAFADKSKLIDLAGGSDKVFDLDGYEELAGILNKLVLQVCGIDES